jgi:WD40 repeat protein
VILCELDGSVRAYEVETGKALCRSLRSNGRAWDGAYYSTDGRTFLTWGGAPEEYTLWDAVTYQPLGPPMVAPGKGSSGSYNLHGTRFVQSRSDGTLWVWEVLEGRNVNLRQLPGADYGEAAFHPDGKTLLARSRDGGYRFFDFATGEPVGPTLVVRGRAQRIAFDRAGKLVALSGGSTAQVWDVATGQPVGSRIRHNDAGNVISLSPDGQLLLTGARLWDVATSKPIGPPLRHDSMLTDAGFRPDGKSMVFGQRNRVIRQCPVPVPVTGTVEHVKLWAQVLTGAELDEHGGVQALDAATWSERRRRLDELGGPPVP